MVLDLFGRFFLNGALRPEVNEGDGCVCNDYRGRVL